MELTRPTLWVLPFTVTFKTPVAPAVTSMLITAVSSTSIITSSKLTVEASLLTSNVLGTDTLELYLSLPTNVATTVKVALFFGVYSYVTTLSSETCLM